LKDLAYHQQYRLFLERLQPARRDAGLTQSEVARSLRRPQWLVSKCESGQRRTSGFARFYAKPLNFFVT
jgi:DNA-binding transcriptional regulator YiaG